MQKFEGKRLDPSPGEVAQLLAEAAEAANAGCKSCLVPDDPAKFRKMARELSSSAEGVNFVRGCRSRFPASSVVLSWWADHVGRKHVVARGHRVESEEVRFLLYIDELRQNPPLWHCYPERLYERTASDGTHWIALCGCGAMGSPENLGWMGDVCGPCHDRREEFGPGVFAEWLPQVFEGRGPAITALAFDADGERLAVGEGERGIAVVPLQGGEPVQFYAQSASQLCFTRNGRYLALDRQNEFIFVALDGQDELYDDEEFDSRFSHGVAHGLGEQDVILGVPYGFIVLEVENNEAVSKRRIDFHNDWHCTPCLSPDGRRVLANTPFSILVFDVETCEQIHSFDQLPHLITNNEWSIEWDGADTLYSAAHPLLFAHNLATGERTQHDCPGEVVNMVFHPSVGLVMATEANLIILDPVTLATRASFRWHLGDVRAFAMTADGRLAATGGNDGRVKLWPLAELLR